MFILGKECFLIPFHLTVWLSHHLSSSLMYYSGGSRGGARERAHPRLGEFLRMRTAVRQAREEMCLECCERENHFVTS